MDHLPLARDPVTGEDLASQPTLRESEVDGNAWPRDRALLAFLAPLR